MKLKLLIFSIVTLTLFNLSAQTTVFSDDFSNYTSTSWTTSGNIGSSDFFVNRSGVDWGARRNTSPAQLELTNDASEAGNVNGWVFSYVDMNSSTMYSPNFQSMSGEINWYFNMRQIRPDPAGFSSGSYGVAFIIGATSTSPFNSGNGYAIVLGQSGSTDPIRLAHFSSGLSGTLTNIITASSPLNDVGTEYLSIRVRLDRSTNTWTLYGRNDGSSAFSDPMSGILTDLGSAVNSTYIDGTTELRYLGGYWQGSTTANQTAFFDNFTITMSNPLPVELVSFTAHKFSNRVKLSWSTATEVNNFGFEIHRSSDQQNWINLGFVSGNGNSNSPKEYSFIDNSNKQTGKYYYRLKQIDTDGSYKYSNSVELDFTLSDQFILEQNYPNPFNPNTKISWQSPINGNQTLKIYDVLGREVTTLVNEFREAGRYEINFSVESLGKGINLSSGVYYYQLIVGDFIETRKMIISK